MPRGVRGRRGAATRGPRGDPIARVRGRLGFAALEAASSIVHAIVRISDSNRGSKSSLPTMRSIRAGAGIHNRKNTILINDVPRRDAREFRPGPRSSLFFRSSAATSSHISAVALANYTPPYGSGRVDTTVDGRTSTVVPGTDCTLSRVTTREHDRSALRAVRIEYFAMQRSHVDRRVVNVHACKRPIFDASLERKPKPR